MLTKGRRDRGKLFWRFRIYPERKSLYFLVWIFKKKKTMLDAIKSTGVAKKQMGKSLRACVVSLSMTRVDPTGKARKHQLCGDIFFWQKDLGVGVTTHEIVHAALNWARRMRLNLSKDEERFCSVVESLNWQLVNRCYDRNIYESN